MADYTYRISASGTASGANAGFTTLNAAISDFKTANRMGAGVGIVAASSVLRFAIDGYMAMGCDLFGIDSTTNSGASIVLDAWSNAWNSTPRRIGAYTSFDGIDLGSSNQANLGASGVRQANLTSRNLVFSGVRAGFSPLVMAYGPTTGTISLLLDGLLVVNSHATQADGLWLGAASMRNCVVYMPASGGEFVQSSSHAFANAIDQCTFVTLGTMTRIVFNQNDPLPIIRNSYLGGNTATFANSGTWSGSCVGNASDAASGFVSGTLYNLARSTANFLNVTAGTEDWRAAPTSALVTTGATRLSNALADVFGTSRATTATIGAYEYSAPASILGSNVTLADVAPTGGLADGGASGISGNVSLADVAPTGGLADSGASTISGNVPLADVAPGGGLSVQPGVLTSAPFRGKLTGLLLASTSFLKVVVLRVSDMAVVLTLADVATNASGVMQITNYALAAGQTYLLITCNSDGTAYGCEACLAA